MPATTPEPVSGPHHGDHGVDASLDLGTMPAAVPNAGGPPHRATGPPGHGYRAPAPTPAPRTTASAPEAVRTGPHEDGRPRGKLAARWASVPLRARLVSILLVALFAALASSGYATQLVLRAYLEQQVDTQLATNADEIAHLVVEALEDGNSQLPLPFNVAVRIRTADGDILGSVRPADGPAPAWPNAVATAEQEASEVGESVRAREIGSVSGQARWRMTSVVKHDRAETLLADVAIPLTEVDHTVRQLRLYVLVVGLIVAVAVTLLGWLAIRRAFIPLVQVEETAAAIATGDLSRRVPEHPPGTEVGRLTSSLNGMLNQIERAFRAREASEARTRRFAADASHELRTPLAAIRGFAELYRQGAVPAEEVPRTLHRIEDEATRMGGLVEDLLLLARLDEQRPGRAEPVDLAVLAGDAVHDARALDPSRTVRLLGVGGSPGPGPALVTGDEDRLRQVVANLVANAVRHTPAGSPIEVAVGAEGGVEGGAGRAVLEVHDHGPGLPDGEAERVFERFYRVDSSRTRGHGGGSGLGLSIVAAVVSAHGGKVAALRTSGGGATFRVEFPLRSAD